MLGIVRVIGVVVCVLVASARADTHKPASKPAPVVARVVKLELYDKDVIVTLAAGSEQGIAKTWHAQFRDGQTQKPLAGGEAIVIRVDHRVTIARTTLSPEQVRANRYVQLAP
jgi:hypothetical protein